MWETIAAVAITLAVMILGVGARAILHARALPPTDTRQHTADPETDTERNEQHD